MLLPLFKGLEIKPNLRNLILTKAVLEAYHNEETLRVVKGTKIKYVSEKQLREE